MTKEDWEAIKVAFWINLTFVAIVAAKLLLQAIITQVCGPINLPITPETW